MNRAELRIGVDTLDRASNRITSWVLGIGLLSFHASFFAVTMVTLLLWNLYDTPSDLWVADVFRRWGAVLLFHAIAVVVGWAIWRMLRAEQRAVDAARYDSNSDASQTAAFLMMPSNGWSPAPEPSVEDRSNRFISATAALGAQTSRWARSAVSNATTKLSTNRPSNGAVTDPTTTWPDPSALHRNEDAEFIARFGEMTSPGFDQIVSIDNTGTLMSDQTAEAINGIGKESGWTWVEAATAPWLNRRETEPAPHSNGHSNGHGDQHSNGSHPAGWDNDQLPPAS